MKKIIAVVLFCAVLFGSCAGGSETSAYKGTFVVKTTTTCGACKLAKPVIDELKKEYGEKIEFIEYSLNDPEQRAKADKYETRMVPAFIIMDSDGNEVFKHEGVLPKSVLEYQIKHLIDN